MKLVRRRTPLAFLAALVLTTGITASTAAAAPAGPASSASLCVVAKGVAQAFTIVPSTATLSTAQSQAVLKKNLGKIVSAKSRLVSASPATLKADMKRVIAAYALLKKDLAGVNWNFAALATKPTVVLALEKTFVKTKGSFTRVTRYFRKTCKY
jgi:hypothetical protein